MVVPVAVGGATDTIGRVMAERMKWEECVIAAFACDRIPPVPPRPTPPDRPQ
jgi:tripartite-type tricarboxylate transporter receptor subunit TctC